MSSLDRDDFRAAGYRLIDLIADHWRDIESRPIAPQVEHSELFERFSYTLEETGIGLEASVEQVGNVMRDCIAMSHPLYLGLVNSSPLPEAVLADLVVSAMDNNGGASHQGPANAAAEREVIRWLADGLDYDGDGMILSGGSHAALQALQIAKYCKFPEWISDGPGALKTRPRLYVAQATHFSSPRAAQVIGLGNRCIAAIPDRGRGEIDPVALRRCVEEDVQRGWRPFAVLATCGSTGTGAIDPLEEIVEICREFDIWLHVDACYGGAAALLESHRHLFRGMEAADSLAVDLHKWFFMPLTAGVLLTRHEQSARELFDVAASYIPAADHTQAYCRGLPTSRRAAGLCAWIALQAAGWETIREAILRNIDLTRDMEQRLAERGFRVMPGGELSVACARWEPDGWGQHELNQLQRDIADSVQRGGDAWFANTACGDEIWLRFNMVNLHSQKRHVEQLVQLVADTARHLSSRGSRSAK